MFFCKFTHIQLKAIVNLFDLYFIYIFTLSEFLYIYLAIASLFFCKANLSASAAYFPLYIFIKNKQCKYFKFQVFIGSNINYINYIQIIIKTFGRQIFEQMNKPSNNKYMNHSNQPRYRKSENYELHLESKNQIPYKNGQRQDQTSQSEQSFEQNILRNSGYQRFQMSNQMFQNQTRQNDFNRQILQKEIKFKQLLQEHYQCTQALHNSQQQNKRLKQTLRNLIPQNNQLNQNFQQVKTTLSSLQQKQQQFMQLLMQKDNTIQKLQDKIKSLAIQLQSQNAETVRRSDLSTLAQFTQILQEKHNLQEKIQQLKKLIVNSNQQNQEKLLKKDQIYNKFKKQSQQFLKHSQEILQKKIQYLQIVQQNLKQARQKQYNLNEQVDQLRNQLLKLTNQLNAIKRYNIESELKVDVSKQIQLKQHYIQILQQTKTQLSQNQLQLQHMFSVLSTKQYQIKLKNQQVQQLKQKILASQNYQRYIQNQQVQLQNTNNQLIRKLTQKDNTLKVLQLENQKKANIKNQNSDDQFSSCNDQKQLLHHQLKNIQNSLIQQKSNNSKLIKQIQNLKFNNITLLNSLNSSSNQHYLNSSNMQNSAYQSLRTSNSDVIINNLKQENQKLHKKMGQKSDKLIKVQSKLKSQYQERIKGLQRQIYRLSTTQPQKIQNNQFFKKQLEIQDLDNEFQHKNYNQKIKSQVELKSRSSEKSSLDPTLKSQIQQLKVQNQSLNAHLQRLSTTLQQTNRKLSLTVDQKYKLQQNLKSTQSQIKNSQQQIKKLQITLKDNNQQLQRFSSLKQLLKIQKDESKQKSIQITQLKRKLPQIQKKYQQLKQDNHNLEQMNQQANQKYQKTLQKLKQQMNQMNAQIIRQKQFIDDKKRQMKRIEQQNINKINCLQDENICLKSKIKKQQLQLIKAQQKIKQIQQQQIQRVVITRTQMSSFKLTQKRMTDIQQQITTLIKQRQRLITQKRNLQNYFKEQIDTLRANSQTQRQKLLRKLTQVQEKRSEFQIKSQKLKQLLEKKRKQFMDMEIIFQKVNKQNYHIKLQLSQSLSEVNTLLVKNKTFAQRFQRVQDQLQAIKTSYEALMIEKSKNDRQKMNTYGAKVQLEMTYKQIEKLNSVLMQKQRQINYLLNQSDNEVTNAKINKYEGSFNQRINQNQYKTMKFQPYAENQYAKDIYNKPQTKKTYETKENRRKNVQEKYIGGFPVEFCSFAPEYHKI